VTARVRHVLLDRDGVLNEERATGPVASIRSWQWIEGSLEALRALTRAEVSISIVTNQSGVGRGLVRADEVDSLHAAVAAHAGAAGARIAAFHVCPHAPDAGCECRKPSPELLRRAIARSGIPAAETVMVGDMDRDLLAGVAAGVRVALVRTGKGRATEAAGVAERLRAPVFDDLRAFVAAMCEVASEQTREQAVSERDIASHFDELADLARLCRDGVASHVATAAARLIDCIEGGHKVLVCGNGGSAADAQHFAAELINRFGATRRALPAIALTTDTSVITSIANDDGYERIFARQVEALAAPGDTLVAISTSGTSGNVVAAALAARARGCVIVALTGAGEAPLRTLADVCIAIPSRSVARIQEMHELCLHAMTDVVDRHFAGRS